MHNMKFGDDLIRGSAMGQDYAIKTGEAVYLDPITITPND
ncbi:hypothetical protein AUTU_22380 [Aureibacter tunicatorum]|nr:hypothetical protein AUTU_22380 [Aureibacter tunicatorum]